MRRLGLPALLGLVASVSVSAGPNPARSAATSQAVLLARVPDGGIQPQVAVDAQGHVHLLYFKGHADSGDLYYTVASAGPFAKAIRVNSQSGSAMATGNMRGAHLAVGRNGLVHVAWFGTAHATPRAPGGSTPMLYARLSPGATSFEAQRNIVQYATGLDGGSVAADGSGRVYVAWHAVGPTAKTEADSRLYVAASADDGATFARERPASDPAIGACGCCGVGALADHRGTLFVLFRSAQEEVHRDTYLLTSTNHAETFTDTRVQAWNLDACPMSTFALLDTPTGVLIGWETAGRVHFTRLDLVSFAPGAVVDSPAGSGTQKYPTLAANDRGEVLFAWTEGMAWQRGGDVVWQVYGPDGRPTAEHGRQSGVPTWSLVAAYAAPDGTFRILY